MKKLLLLVLLLAGCNDPKDTNYTSEMLVEHNCEPTGSYFYREETTQFNGQITSKKKVKYYIYTCEGGKKISETLIIDPNKQMPEIGEAP
ncbi:hypothetical protein JA33_049 [Dickeya phage vB_DsoM_JA33]|uniref:Uncharacterized protein n=3 Tax=Salmondvirus JA11 TaxID=2734141 RepID=A0A384ZW47_9CAUD|nr:hypothetical protein HOU32_gp049 [Dickeya phage vB_DsoM_JA11]AXG66454.1 hypothetical protein JA13_051 [Dickeya phage vB_DsoM_JA13]AXG67423.1 hypothetical protein JA33_049 [Dickeya phage vB_DsoM_JA33]AYD79854.1 hypothetical protein JA11_049 [Dickeya phage vB_DsoM_JA11]